MSMQRAFIKALVLAVFASVVVLAAGNQHVITHADLIAPSQLNSQLAAVIGRSRHMRVHFILT